MTFRDRMVEAFRSGRAAGERVWRKEWARWAAVVVILIVVALIAW